MQKLVRLIFTIFQFLRKISIRVIFSDEVIICDIVGGTLCDVLNRRVQQVESLNSKFKSATVRNLYG